MGVGVNVVGTGGGAEVCGTIVVGGGAEVGGAAA